MGPTLAVVEELGDGLHFEEDLLISAFVSELVEVLVHECLGGSNPLDWRVLHDLGDQVDEEWVPRLEQLL